jgi:hypothetical protein
MKRSLRIALAMAALGVGAFCADNTIGTWKLVPEKSKPAAGQSRITSLTVVREAAGDGVKGVLSVSLCKGRSADLFLRITKDSAY